MPALRDAQRELAALRASHDAAVFETRALGLRAEQLSRRLAQLTRVAHADPDARREAASIEREIAELAREAEESRRDVTFLRDRVNRTALDLATVPVDDLFTQLDDHLPFLLFPVRLETRFAHDGETARLRVRIFPDDILISTHDPLLSESEREAGAAYWRERARALTLDPEERRTAEQGAWTLLATRFGGPRARFVARQTKPALWPPSGEAVAPPPAADDEPARSAGGSAPPRARLLPDYFVVIALDVNNRVVVQQSGRPIPDSLLVGPDPEATTATLERDANGRLSADPELAWLIDYERAVEVGMAVTLPVDANSARIGFHRVIAIGAKLSLDPRSAAAAVEDLFAEHRFTNGIDILRQGTPTNNTDRAASGFTTDLSADEALVAQEVDGVVATSVLDHAGKSDIQRLSEGLGITFEAINDWPTASEAFDAADALAMNRALWPATLGTFLRDQVGTRLDAALKSDVERFFLTYVTGRGLLPNIRVGSQPYGVLATSDLRFWTEAPAEPEPGGGMATIVEGLAWYRGHFIEIARNPETPIAQLGGGADPLATTMRVVGQLASSVAFVSRKAIPDDVAWNTLHYTNVIPLIRMNWWTTLEAARNANFQAMGLDHTGLPVASLVFFGEVDPLLVPLIDQDPVVPLSETEQITKFDGARNYIHWLLTASEEELRLRTFKNANGEPIDAPRALLFRLLHHAWTAQLAASASDVLTRFHPELVSTTASTSIANVGPLKVVPDESASLVDTAKLELTVNPRRLGDHLLDLVRSGSTYTSDAAPEALPLLTQREAMERIANRPTAVLERLFTEHLDLAAYRLDAWQTGLVARRLDHMRRCEGRSQGVYLGAYGYVENLVPKVPPIPVDPARLPEKLRGTTPVVEQQGNGGFVHAPSLPHAVTAAVLRNGYLTHAEPQNREPLSVNLTSRRVRTAMQFVEGMRAGQELAALLGYQLERGLHENHPGIELDEFIYVLRARFPLVSRRLTPTPANVPAEVVEARNVIDGHDLLQHIRQKPQYPYDIAGLPSAADKANAIQVEIARLEETLDAVADLMTAESVHQTAQSNIDRARGTLGAISDGEMPPVPDVVVSPRSGRVFTQRVALHLPPAGAGWTSPPSPRARANRRLNAWLVRQLPAPESIGFEVRPAGAPAETVTLEDAGLDAIDVVLMCGDRFGEGSSELERFLADAWRAANGIEDDVVTLFKGPAPPPGEKRLVVDLGAASEATPLGTLLPQLRALRRLAGSARGLNAQDYRLSVDFDKADPRNPKGYRLDASGDLDALPARVASARNGLDNLADGLEGELDSLAPLYDAVRQDASSFDATEWSVGLASLRRTLRRLALFGSPEALPRSAFGVNAAAALGLYAQGRAVLAAIRKRLERADQQLAPLPGEPPLDDPAAEARRVAGRLELRLTRLAGAAHETLGASFPVQPIVRLSAAARVEIEARLAAPIETDPLAVEAWLQSLSRVRPRIADLALACAAVQWTLGAEPRLVPVQLPLRKGDPWIGARWTAPPEEGEIMSVMTIDAPASLDADIEGLLLDDWTEVVPMSKETTGIAFHFDRPNAAAPQALLLAVPPNPDGTWQWNELFGAVLDTFERARLRAIEPDQIAASPLFTILPMTLLSFTSGVHPALASTFLVDRATASAAPPE